MMSCEYLRPSRRDKGKVSFALFSDICSEASDCRLSFAASVFRHETFDGLYASLSGWEKKIVSCTLKRRVRRRRMIWNIWWCLGKGIRSENFFFSSRLLHHTSISQSEFESDLIDCLLCELRTVGKFLFAEQKMRTKAKAVARIFLFLCFAFKVSFLKLRFFLFQGLKGRSEKTEKVSSTNFAIRLQLSFCFSHMCRKRTACAHLIPLS